MGVTILLAIRARPLTGCQPNIPEQITGTATSGNRTSKAFMAVVLVLAALTVIFGVYPQASGSKSHLLGSLLDKLTF